MSQPIGKNGLPQMDIQQQEEKKEEPQVSQSGRIYGVQRDSTVLTQGLKDLLLRVAKAEGKTPDLRARTEDLIERVNNLKITNEEQEKEIQRLTKSLKKVEKLQQATQTRARQENIAVGMGLGGLGAIGGTAVGMAIGSGKVAILLTQVLSAIGVPVTNVAVKQIIKIINNAIAKNAEATVNDVIVEARKIAEASKAESKEESKE